MNRRVAIAFSLLTLMLLVSCGDGSPSTPEPDIDATVEARVAEALAESVSTPRNTPTPILATPQTFAESVITAFKQPSFGEWKWRTGFDEGNARVTVGTSHQNSRLTLSGDVVTLIVPFSGNPVIDEYSTLYIGTLTALSCPEEDMDNSFWTRIDFHVSDALTFRSRGERYDMFGQRYIPLSPSLGRGTSPCSSRAIGFRGLSLYVLEMVVADTGRDIYQLWDDAIRGR